MKKIAYMLLCLACVALFLTAAYAQFSKPEDAVKYRKAAMTLIGHHFGRMASVVKGQQPYVRADFSGDAELVERLSKLPWEAFMVPGTAQGDTDLKPEALRPRSRNSSVPQTAITSGPSRISSGRLQNRARAATGSSGPVKKRLKGPEGKLQSTPVPQLQQPPRCGRQPVRQSCRPTV